MQKYTQITAASIQSSIPKYVVALPLIGERCEGMIMNVLLYPSKTRQCIRIRVRALIAGVPNEPSRGQEQAQTESIPENVGVTLREALKGDLVELLTKNPDISGRELTDRTSRMIESNIEKLGSRTVAEGAVASWSREMGAGMSPLLQAGIEHRSGANERDRTPNGRRIVSLRTPMNQVHER